MKSLLGYQRGVVISEQSVATPPAATTSVSSATADMGKAVSNTINIPEQAIVSKLIKATLGPGTKEKDFVAAVNEIKTAEQFSIINELLKTQGLKLDFVGLVNDEFGVGDWGFVSQIIEKLKTLKITATANKYGTNTMTKNSFKITSQLPVVDLKKYVANVTSKSDASGGGATNPQKATVFTPNEKFPLKLQQQGEKIKQLQTALGVKNKAGQPNITGKFWTATELAIKNKAKELGLVYDRVKGVDENMFNKIVSSPQTSTSTEPKTTTSPGAVNPVTQNLANRGFQDFAQTQFGTQLQ